MTEQTRRALAPPGGLRPAQLGVVLVGRVMLSHIGATIVDLAGRGFLTIEMTEGDPPGWRLTFLDEEPADLLEYERILLDALFGGRKSIVLESLPDWMPVFLDKVRSEIVRDAIAGGRLGSRSRRQIAVLLGRRIRHDRNPGRRTGIGEELLRDGKAFKRALRAVADVGDTETLKVFAPYAMIFGLDAPIAGNQPGAQTRSFTTRWLKACGGARDTNEVQWWWDPTAGASHDHARGDGAHSGHGSAHGGLDGWHGGGFDGGHGGGFDGGHG